MVTHKAITIEEEIKLTRKSVENPSLHYNLQNGKSLTVIGTNHSRNRKDVQFNYISKEIAKIKPDCVILELPQKEIDRMKYDSKAIRWKYYGESGFIYNILPENIIKIGGDIERNKLCQLLLKQDKFSKDEINAYRVYATMISEIILYNQKVKSAIKRAGEFENVKITDKIKKIMNDYTKKYNNKELEMLTSKDDLTIYPLFKKCVLSRIAREIGQIRDCYMLKVIRKTSKSHNRIMFFAGRNHILRLKNRLNYYFLVQRK